MVLNLHCSCICILNIWFFAKVNFSSSNWLIVHFVDFQQPAINVLKEIQVFLEANPSEIVTIFIEDYVTSTQGLTKIFNASGLSTYWFPVSRMPKNGGDWPTVDDMVQKNQRLVVFTSKSSKEATEGIAYQWRYVVENQCEFYLFLMKPVKVVYKCLLKRMVNVT